MFNDTIKNHYWNCWHNKRAKEKVIFTPKALSVLTLILPSIFKKREKEANVSTNGGRKCEKFLRHSLKIK